MKAVVYKKPFEVGVEEVTRPELTHPDDIIVKGAYNNLVFRCAIFEDTWTKVTTTCICGRSVSLQCACVRPFDIRISSYSDLHMYEGRTAAEPGIVFGHEKWVLIIVASNSNVLIFACSKYGYRACTSDSAFLLNRLPQRFAGSWKRCNGMSVFETPFLDLTY